MFGGSVLLPKVCLGGEGGVRVVSQDVFGGVPVVT